MLNMNPLVLFQYLLHVFLFYFNPSLRSHSSSGNQDAFNHSGWVISKEDLHWLSLYMQSEKSTPTPLWLTLPPDIVSWTNLSIIPVDVFIQDTAFFFDWAQKEFFLYFSNVKIYPPPLFGTTLIWKTWIYTNWLCFLTNCSFSGWISFVKKILKIFLYIFWF